MKLLCRLVRRRRRSVASLSALAVFLIGSLADAAVARAAEEAAGGGGGLFDVNWLGLMFWTWLIFILLFLVLRKWAWGPILGALEAREKRIQETLDGAARDRDQAQRLLEQQQSLLDESRDQAQQILAESRKAGDRMRVELLEEARKQKDEIVARAKDEIDRERDQALETLRREAVDLSISAAGRVLEKNLDTRENRRLVEEYLAGLAAEERGEKAD